MCCLRVVRNVLFVACSSLRVMCCLFVVVYWLRIGVCCLMSALFGVGCVLLLFVVCRCSLFVVCCVLLVFRVALFAAFLLFVMCCALFVVCCAVVVVCCLLVVGCCLVFVG